MWPEILINNATIRFCLEILVLYTFTFIENLLLNLFVSSKNHLFPNPIHLLGYNGVRLEPLPMENRYCWCRDSQSLNLVACHCFWCRCTEQSHSAQYCFPKQRSSTILHGVFQPVQSSDRFQPFLLPTMVLE